MSLTMPNASRIPTSSALRCMRQLGERDGARASRLYEPPDTRPSAVHERASAPLGDAFYARFADDVRDMSAAGRARLAQLFRRELQLARTSGSEEEVRHYERLLRIVEASPPGETA
jgi:hypothetical protein